jgi:hypothetical protein
MNPMGTCKRVQKGDENAETSGGETRTRQDKINPPRSNPNGAVQKSPGLARRQPWAIARRCHSTPTGLRPGGRRTSRVRCPPATTPLGLMAPPSPLPRVGPSVQPWALIRNRVAVEAPHYLWSRPLRFIDTVASARCKEAPGALQPFQRFGWVRGKPLKRLGQLATYSHRAEAAVLMRDSRLICATLVDIHPGGMKDGSRGSKRSETPGPATARIRIPKGCQKGADASRPRSHLAPAPGCRAIAAIDLGSPLRRDPRLPSGNPPGCTTARDTEAPVASEPRLESIAIPDFGPRISDFGFPSDFGFRISDFPPDLGLPCAFHST